ncbi:Protein BPS1, chloroplastic [Glycine soja]
MLFCVITDYGNLSTMALSLKDPVSVKERRERFLQAMKSLCESHNDIWTLMTAFELPVSDWEDKWIDVYFDISSKLLDICNGFSSELSRVNQENLPLKKMKTISGYCVSVKDISVSKAAKILTKFVSADNGASHVINTYLHQASASFNELKQLHKELGSSHSHKKHKRRRTENDDENFSQQLDGFIGYETENVDGGEMHKKKKKKKQEVKSLHDIDSTVKFGVREADGKLPNGSQNESLQIKNKKNHNLDSASSKQYLRACSLLDDWRQHVSSRNPRIEKCSSMLHNLVGSLDLPKVKNSAKGKVLMQAMYRVKVETVFICRVFTAAFFGSSKKLSDLNVADIHSWAPDFRRLQNLVNEEIRVRFSGGKFTILNELEAVDASVKILYPTIQAGVDTVEIEWLVKTVEELRAENPALILDDHWLKWIPKSFSKCVSHVHNKKIASSNILLACTVVVLFCATLLCLQPKSTASALGNDTDQLSSLRFKEAVENNPFNVLASWNSSTHFCKWHGVTCSLNHQRVSAINLQGYALRGFITPEIDVPRNQVWLQELV